MLTGSLTLVQVPDYFGEGPYQLTVTTDIVRIPLRLFVAEAAWRRFAQALTTFPRTVAERLQLDARQTDPSRHSLLLEAYCYDAAGHCALRLAIDTNYPEPHRYQLTFSLPAEAASLNQLGAQLSQWLLQPYHPMQWKAQLS